ncbi:MULTISPECIES: bifunctional phosphoribosyl-AMP cyclohydrolase/phosphoribosyl-ATP diphosphatase HisIE [Pseudothermotoga]|uniref:bifunctional phosphoribosyl-AMP cyclohydrolase/phosphoribosyl-ATP diphosphatase HisIE n=1 Tax=Pseudothermotoga TaxID=1643951 RepID=UPI00042588A4|nr:MULTISPECIES: bifunctional phosphoribosyl-AMP cyclohydrolase/phosphoribosyl-ATP diphosphatase HisIE [Pseudothermotoga]MDI6862213.1 bifunctional phosphoribosyl-AMP cyclohydrolase/phosphoribosyl-ATP diphosphatase HisIE [Pseudothermotoga sp.]
MLRPVVVQEAFTKEVLMLAYADEEALRLTKETGFAHFYSRSRQKIWKKGEESGNTMRVLQIVEDCDRDALLYLVEFPENKVACHTGRRSCFFNVVHGENVKDGLGFLQKLHKIVEDRKNNPTEGSYTTSLFRTGLDEILKKFGEESIEVILAAKHQTKERLINEISDLIYHLIVLMCAEDVSWNDVIGELEKRSKKCPENERS